MRDYLEARTVFDAAYEASSHDDEVPLPARPEMPEPLRWYLSCQEYHCLLVAGGLLDQPAWAWQEVETAGSAYRDWLDIQARLAATREGESK